MEKQFYDIELTFAVPLSNAQRQEVSAALTQIAQSITNGQIVLSATAQLVLAQISASQPGTGG
jgi:F0F1-type ATP synthase delta subunit